MDNLTVGSLNFNNVQNDILANVIKNKIKLQIHATDERDTGSLQNKIKGAKIIDIVDLPDELLKLARMACEVKYNQEVIISFPKDNTEIMDVEVYNSFRE